jgi:hypothetical protein
MSDSKRNSNIQMEQCASKEYILRQRLIERFCTPCHPGGR